MKIFRAIINKDMTIMTDKILNMFFDIDRWTNAIEKGVGKDIRKDQLIRLTDEYVPIGNH